jgi:hypothetical protein
MCPHQSKRTAGGLLLNPTVLMARMGTPRKGRCVGAVLAAFVLASAVVLPASAHALTLFRTPARNIHCGYVPRETGLAYTPNVRCDVDFPTRFVKPPPRCDTDFGDSFRVTERGHGEALCHGDTIKIRGAWIGLRVGVPRQFGAFTCTAPSSNAIRCASRVGHGFAVSPTRQVVF